MSVELESTIARLNDLLPYVARDAERYRNPTELVTKSRELHLAAAALNQALPYPGLARFGKVISLRIGTNPVQAYDTRSLPYDFVEVIPSSAEAGEIHDLRYKYEVQTDILNQNHRQPVYGQLRYFDLATLGRTLKDGGELFVANDDSSSNT